MAESHSLKLAQWRRTIDLVTSSFAGRFARVEPRRAAAGFVTGLLADLEIKTCWQLAEQAGHGRPDAMQRLFQPFYRATVRRSLQGLGLGLYIASEIARAHGGTLGADSSPDETRFTFRMPIS